MAPPKITHPALYRALQFFVALKASLPSWAGGGKGGLTAADKALVASILPAAAQQRLFTRMPPNDRRHAIAVARTLQQAGHNHRALIQAALLHDVAKSIGQPIIHRVLIVLFEAFWPAGLEWLATPGEQPEDRRQEARGRGQGAEGKRQKTLIGAVSWWRRPFVIHAQHPAIGATWAQEVACEPLAAKLIARHQDVLEAEPIETEEKLLAALQWADDLN